MTVFMYTADYCSTCKVMKPIFQELCDKYKIDFVEVDVGVFPEEATDLQITTLPTFLFCKDGLEDSRHAGAMARHAIEKKLKEYV